VYQSSVKASLFWNTHINDNNDQEENRVQLLFYCGRFFSVQSLCKFQDNPVSYLPFLFAYLLLLLF